MVTLTILMIFTGFFFLYHTSKRAEPSRSTRLAKWIIAHSKVSQGIGLVLLISSAPIAIYIWGLAAGLFFYFVVLMIWASLVVMLGPLRVLGPKTVLTLSVLSLLIESAFYAG